MSGLVRRAAIAVAGAGLLAGCGLFSGPPEEPPPCPRVGILEGAEATTARDLRAGRDPAAVRYVAGLGGLSSTCRYGEEGLELDLTFNLVVEKGPAIEQTAVPLTYFVAMVAPDGQIRSKQRFNSEIQLEPGRPVAGVAEALTVRYPDVTPAAGATLRVFVGLQVDPTTGRRGTPRLLR